MNKKNLAYDLSLFEEKETNHSAQVIQISKKNSHFMKNKKNRVLSMLYISFICVGIISVLAVMIYSRVQLTELTEELNVANKTLSESESINTQLKMKAESQMSLKYVENYARNELFMNKIEPSQIDYIILSDGDKAEIVYEKKFDSLFDSIKNLFS